MTARFACTHAASHSSAVPFRGSMWRRRPTRPSARCNAAPRPQGQHVAARPTDASRCSAARDSKLFVTANSPPVCLACISTTLHPGRRGASPTGLTMLPVCACIVDLRGLPLQRRCRSWCSASCEEAPLGFECASQLRTKPFDDGFRPRAAAGVQCARITQSPVQRIVLRKLLSARRHDRAASFPSQGQGSVSTHGQSSATIGIRWSASHIVRSMWSRAAPWFVATADG